MPQLGWNREFDSFFQVPVRYERCVSESREGVRTYAPAVTVLSSVNAALAAQTRTYTDNVPRWLVCMRPFAASGGTVRVTVKDLITLPSDAEWTGLFSAPHKLTIRDSTPIFDERSRIAHFEVLA